MKLNEILIYNLQLDEVNFRQAAIAGLITLTALTGGSGEKTEPVKVEPVKIVQPVKKSQVELDRERLAYLASTILDKYKINDKLAVQVAALAQKYEKSDFPKAEDILAVVGIESSFNPNAKSNLKKDPAKGLMQIRHGIWNLEDSSMTSLDAQIKNGTEILYKYYKKLNDADNALHAYNVGITNFMKKKNLNPTYVAKVNAERTRYED